MTVAILAACDPAFALVVDNQSSENVLVGRFLEDVGVDTSDVVIAPANSRTTIGAFGVTSTDHPYRIVLMTQGCAVVGDVPLSEAFIEGGTFMVGGDSKVTVVPGGDPSRGVNAAGTKNCLTIVQGLKP
jgi:hypothetical protein